LEEIFTLDSKEGKSLIDVLFSSIPY